MNGVIPIQQNNVLDINSMKIVTKGKKGLSRCDFSACSYSIRRRQRGMESGTAITMSAKHWDIMSGICLL